MLLAVDIGNTSISLGVFCGKRLVKTLKIPTRKCSSDRYLRYLRFFLHQAKVKPELLHGTIVASVVPPVMPFFKQALLRLSPAPVLIVGRDLKAPIRNRYRRPEEVGQDRLVNAVAGKRLCGTPLIIVDFGTAITCDVISTRGEYLGGSIVPGFELSLRALSEKTALLPLVRLRRPPELIGGNTVNSILSGMTYGFSALVDGLVKRLKSRFRKRVTVIATGGQARLLARYCREVNRIIPHLTLQGLKLIWDEYAARSIQAKK